MQQDRLLTAVNGLLSLKSRPSTYKKNCHPLPPGVTHEAITLNCRVTHEVVTLNCRVTHEAVTLNCRVTHEAVTLTAGVTHDVVTLNCRCYT